MKMENMEIHLEAFRCYKPQKGDVVVIRPESNRQLSHSQCDYLRQQFEAALPEFVPVIVVPYAINVDVLRTGEST